MKRSILLSLAVIIYSLSFGQIGTSIEEYNYATKGLRMQFESGLDIKKGYSVEIIDTVVFYDKYRPGEGLIFDILKLERTDSVLNKIAAYVIRYGYITNYVKKDIDKGYYCLIRPESTDEVKELFRNSILERTDETFLHGLIFTINTIINWQ